jgi:hypothetical protein
MRKIFLPLILLISIFFMISGYQSTIADETPKEEVLLAAILFYAGYNTGQNPPTTCLQLSRDYGQTWKYAAWKEQKAVEVDKDGKNIYVAAADGVLISNDGGRNWWLSSSWRLAELEEVRIGANPSEVWVACAYGAYYSNDYGKTWTQPGTPQPFRYLQTVCPDSTDSDFVLIGSEKGLYITENKGKDYYQFGPKCPIREIQQDLRNPDIFRIGSDGLGLFKLVRSKKTCEEIKFPSEIVNCIYQYPENPEIFYCGIKHGVSYSLDNMKTWKTSTDGFGEFSPVYGIQVDIHNPKKIYAGARDGFFISEDGGNKWTNYKDKDGNIVFDKACITDFWQGELYRGPEIKNSGSNEFKVNTVKPDSEEFRDEIVPGFEDRKDFMRKHFADRAEKSLKNIKPGETSIGFFDALSLIKEGRASDEMWDSLRERIEHPGNSMFSSIQAIGLYLRCKDQLPDDIRQSLREILTKNDFCRGDTENHWTMFYAYLLLASQEFRDVPASEWFRGVSSQVQYDEAKAWFDQWSMIATTIGQGEFDSPHYIKLFMVACTLLYDFAEDPAIKQKAGMMIDLTLADYAAESLGGRYCGGHSRVYEPYVLKPLSDGSVMYYYLYFGNMDNFKMPVEDDIMILPCLYSDYRCPKTIADIALTRDEPYVHTEMKRVRNCIRYVEEMNPPAHKYTYMTPDYALGSLQGGILQPIQQHTWDVTWVGEAENTTLFSLHPYYDAYELAMFFPEDPHMLTASVQSQKSTYTNPDKVTSSSPYERVFQSEDTLIAAYNIPDKINYPYVLLYVPDCLNMTEEDGWLLGCDGNTYIAVYQCKTGEWMKEPTETYPPARRIKVPAGQAAFVVEIGRKESDKSFKNFKEIISDLAAPIFTETDGGPSIVYTNRHGNELSYSWRNDTRFLDSCECKFPESKFFNSRFIQSDLKSRIIKIFGKDKMRTLDFNSLTIEEGI